MGAYSPLDKPPALVPDAVAFGDPKSLIPQAVIPISNDRFRTMNSAPATLLAILSFAQICAAQPHDWDQVREQTGERLWELVQTTPGITGLVATDLGGTERFAINETVIFPQASAIKILVLVEVLRQSDVGLLNLDDRLEITSADQVGGSGVIKNLGVGSALTLRDLAILMIVASDNTATNMLLDQVGIDAINELSEDLGLQDTAFGRRMMDFAASTRGDENVSTPLDAAEVMTRLARRELVSSSVSAQALDILRKPKHGPLRESVPEHVPVTFKEGTIPGVLTTWAFIELPRRPFVLVFMHKLGIGGEGDDLLRNVGEVLYQHYSRLDAATAHGAYVVPE